MNAHAGKTATRAFSGSASAEALARTGFTVSGTSRRTINSGPNQLSADL